jgi:hypothetical protein
MAIEGDILGLGGPIKSDADLDQESAPATTIADEEEKRRRRMSEGADELTPTASETTPRRSSGATGIDMGAGGRGTDIE